MKEINVKSSKQAGGITAGVINISKSKNHPESMLNKWAAIATIVGTIIVILTFLNFDNMFKKQTDSTQTAQELYNVKSKYQTGGVTAGKIENLNIFTDKESLEIKEPLGLYRNGKKVGMVVNPNNITERRASTLFNFH